MAVSVGWLFRLRPQAKSEPPPAGQVSPALTDGMVGEPYQSQLKVIGRPGDYEWNQTSGSLPSGLTLDPMGTIKGTPAGAGITRLTVQYAGPDGRKSSPHTVSLTIHPQLKITHVSRRTDLGEPGQDFLADLHAEGGAGGYRWSKTPEPHLRPGPR